MEYGPGIVPGAAVELLVDGGDDHLAVWFTVAGAVLAAATVVPLVAEPPPEPPPPAEPDAVTPRAGAERRRLVADDHTRWHLVDGTTSLPKGSRASGTSLKQAMPSGMPTMVRHSMTPATTSTIASSQPNEHDPQHVAEAAEHRPRRQGAHDVRPNGHSV